jgi:DAK2 domain fusion protein YloV
MQTLGRLEANDLVAVITTYRDLLRIHRERINDLNVYPVPDGDTGTNMALTLESVVEEIAAVSDPSMPVVAAAISHGSLMGARGNSGVILSQILRGMAGAFAEPLAQDGIDGAVLLDGLRRARKGAYEAVGNPVEGTILVGNPVEGTILTVIRAAADPDWELRTTEAGADTAGGDQAHAGSLVEVVDEARARAAVALSRTTAMLPALGAAGVVDSGGSGLVLFFDALLHVIDGRPLPESVAEGRDGSEAAATEESGSSDAVGELRYEVMYLLEAPDESIREFRKVWAGVGDSIVVVGGDGLYNCHIHTDDIGAAIEAALDAGRPRRIRVSDLWDQIEEERWVREAAASDLPETPEEPVACAVIAVCNGEGVRRIFRSLGVTRTVSGGQSMNPSTAELLEAIEGVPSDNVVVLPNNKNIIPVAEAAASQSTKSVRVVPTVGVPEGFGALLEYDPEGDADANADAMSSSAARVVAGEVTCAVRDAEGPDGPIRSGDWLGLTRAGIKVVAKTAADAAIGVLSAIVDDRHHEMATIIVGEGASASETRQVTEWFAETWPSMSVEVHSGGQPLYPYLFGIE